MSARKAAAKPKDREALINDLLAVGLCTVGALILASLISYTYGAEGVLTVALARALLYVLGIGAWGVPVIAFGMAIVYGIDTELTAGGRTLFGICILYIALLTGLHLAVGLRLDVAPNEMFDAEMLRAYGGLLGAAGSYVLRVIFGPIASYIVLGGLAAAAVVLITRYRIIQLVSHTREAATNGIKAAARPLAQRTSSTSAGRKTKQTSGGKKVRRERSGPGVDLDEEPPRKPNNPNPAPAPPPPEIADPQAEEAPDSSPPPAELKQEADYSGPAPPRESDANSFNHQANSNIDILADAQKFKLPPLSLLHQFDDAEETEAQRDETNTRMQKLEETLDSFGIDARVTDYKRGPVITRYEVEPDAGVRVNKVTRLADNIALSLAATNVRMEAPIPGKSAIGIEVPNKQQSVVGIRSIIEESSFRDHPSTLPIALGRDIAGEAVIADLVNMPHLLVAGATNSGKSVCLHTIILSFLMRNKPHEVQFIMIDAKRVELTRYDGIPHLMAPVVYGVSQAVDCLRKAIREMEKRYDKFAKISAANIQEYNLFAAGARCIADEDYVNPAFLQEKMDIDEIQAARIMDMLEYGDCVREPDDPQDDYKVIIDRADDRCLPMPRVVIVIDELADLMMQARAEFEFCICRIAQLARATGIHLVIATQRPSVKVLTGNIKANIPSRIALAATSQVDSRVILDEQGAERLIGRGDMLFAPLDAPKPRRCQGSFVQRSDIERVAEYLREQGEPSFTIVPQEGGAEDDDDDRDFTSAPDVSDDLYAAAVQHVVQEQEASVSMIQRRFKVGYARAGRIIDAMERRGVVGPHVGPKPRTVLVAPGKAEEAINGTLQQQQNTDQPQGGQSEQDVQQPSPETDTAGPPPDDDIEEEAV